MKNKSPLVTQDIFRKALLVNGLSEEGAEFISQHYDNPRLRSTARQYVNKTFDADYRVKILYRPQKLKKTISQALRKFVFERDAYRCVYCGDWHDLTVDHIYPEALGGTLDPDNLQTLCRPCNSKKGTRV